MANEETPTPKPSVEATPASAPAAPAPAKGAWAREQARRQAALTGTAQPITTGYVAVDAPDAKPEPVVITHHRNSAAKEEK